MTNFWKGAGVAVGITALILLIVYWNNIWSWVRSLGNSGSENVSGENNPKRTYNGDDKNKYTCEFINARGEVVTITGEGERFRQLCEKAKRSPYTTMNLTEYGYPYYYYPYRYYYYYPYYRWYYFPYYKTWNMKGRTVEGTVTV